MISQSLLQETVDALTIKRAVLGDKKSRHIFPDGSINESKSVAISTSYLNLSTLSSRQTLPGTAAYLPL